MIKLNKNIPKMALPLILSNITVPLLGLSNTIIAGHLAHSDYLAAMGLGAMIFNFLYWGLVFFRLSSTGLIAQAYGAKNQQEIHSVLLHSIGLAIVIGLILIALQYPLYKFTQLLIHPNENALHLLKQYFLIRIWGAPAVLVNFVLIGTMVAIQKTRGPLILLTVINFTAILLSIILVFSFDLAIKGIAIADIVAQYFGLVIGFIILSKYYRLREIFRHAKFQINKLKKLLHTNRDIFIRSLCLITVFSFFTIWSSHISPLILAVNTLLMIFFQIMADAIGGFDNVAETLAGEAVGKKQFRSLKKVIFDVGIWVAIFSLSISLVYIIFGKYIIDLITNIDIVRTAAYQYLPYVALMPVIAFTSFLFDGIAIGANLFKEMRNSMIVTLILFFLLWLILRDYGNAGLWLSFYGFFIFRTIFLGYCVLKFYRQQA